MKKTGLKKYAFTLAETLIALTIIGICAAMVIPSLKNLNQHTMNKETEVMSRKTVTNFSNATNQILMNHSKTRKMNGVYASGTSGAYCTDSACLLNLYKKYLSITKTLAKADIENNDTLPGDVYGVLADGVIFGITYKVEVGDDGSNKCANTLNGMQTLPDSSPVDGTNLCGYIYFDVNGTKAPNDTYKDRFVMPIYKSGIRIKSAS